MRELGTSFNTTPPYSYQRMTKNSREMQEIVIPREDSRKHRILFEVSS